MVKLFDFKFLILLGLAIVIYFIYKELESQRGKLQECEKKILLLSTNTNLILPNSVPPTLEQTTYELLALRKQELVKLQEKTQNKLYQDNQVQNNNLELSLPVFIQSCSIQSCIIEETSSSETSNVKNSIHLEIYSNENIFTVNTSNVEAISNNSSQSQKVIVPEVIVQEVIVPEVIVTEVIVPEVIVTEVIVPEVIVPEVIVSEVIVPEAIVQEVDQCVEESQVVVIQSNNENKFNMTNLLRMKVSELQDLAKLKNLNLEKNINGVIKKKTKQELADEIFKL